MAPKLLKVPLTVSLKERLKDKIRQDIKAHRIAPPTAMQVATVHRLPPPVEPSTEVTEPVAKKKTRKRYGEEEKAKAVVRALKGQESGEEKISDIAAEIGVSSSLIYRWMQSAKEANGAPPGGNQANPGKKPKATIESLSRELSEALARVDTLKVKLRKLLE